MDLNHVTLTGTRERDPITRLQDTGMPQVRCTRRLDEPGPAGQRCPLCVPCAASSSAAVPAGDLDHGDTYFRNPVSEMHLSGSRFSDIA